MDDDYFYVNIKTIEDKLVEECLVPGNSIDINDAMDCLRLYVGVPLFMSPSYNGLLHFIEPELKITEPAIVVWCERTLIFDADLFYKRKLWNGLNIPKRYMGYDVVLMSNIVTKH